MFKKFFKGVCKKLTRQEKKEQEQNPTYVATSEGKLCFENNHGGRTCVALLADKE